MISAVDWALKANYLYLVRMLHIMLYGHCLVALPVRNILVKEQKEITQN